MFQISPILKCFQFHKISCRWKPSLNRDTHVCFTHNFSHHLKVILCSLLSAPVFWLWPIPWCQMWSFLLVASQWGDTVLLWEYFRFWYFILGMIYTSHMSFSMSTLNDNACHASGNLLTLENEWMPTVAWTGLQNPAASEHVWGPHRAYNKVQVRWPRIKLSS